MRPRNLLFVLGALALPAWTQEPATVVTYADLLRQVTDLDWLWRLPPAGETCVQFSSFDRASRKGPADPKAWYANGDAAQFLRTEERGGRKEWVMVDTDGPGTVVRIWSANSKGRLFFYFDGEVEPSWSIDFADLTSGKKSPFLPPLAGVSSRGWNCHLPFPFARHLKITNSEKDFYYQVNVRRFAPGTTTPTWRAEWLDRQAGSIDALRAAFAATPAARFATFPGGSDGQAQVAAGEVVAHQVGGPAIVRGLRFRLRQGGALAPPDVLRAVIVRIAVDGALLASVPFSDFFGSAPAFKPHGGWPVAVDADGFGYCFLPIPVRERAAIELVNEGSEAIELETTIKEEKGEVPAGALVPHVSWHQAKGLATRPFSDHLVLDAAGPGRFVGCALMVRNPSKAWWGEGDEKFWVDGEDFPSTFGTGTEDYFGYAWCCPEPFSHPYHSQPQCDGPANFGFTCVNRWQILDQVPFQKSFRFDLEVWHWDEKVKVDYATTAWWYGRGAAKSGLPELPPFAERRIVPLPPPVALVIEGALEAEKLRVVAATGGHHEAQDLSAFADGKWSHDTQLWWIDGQPGDKLTLALPAQKPGKYTVRAAFTKACDYGIVQCWLGGRKLGSPIDLYNPSVVPSGAIDLGAVEIGDAPAEFTLEITGRNEKSVARHMVGLDYLKLEPVK